MWSIEIPCRTDEKDLLIAEFFERGTHGVIESEQPGGRWILRAFFDQPFDAGAHGGVWRAEEEEDWIQRSREAWQPLLVGQRFFVVPAWRDDPAPAGRLRLEVHPGLACGTGYMESTQLVLEAMERWLQPGDRVVDVGTGSGILLSGAALLGAGRVVGCDIDAGALAFSSGRVPHAMFVGSLRAVRAGAADFLAANINARTLVSLAAEIRRVLAPGGRVAAAGFHASELARLEGAVGLPRLDLLEANGWVCLVAGEKPGEASTARDTQFVTGAGGTASG
jgi:ribosomal protein L11 methyltransferase